MEISPSPRRQARLARGQLNFPTSSVSFSTTPARRGSFWGCDKRLVAYFVDTEQKSFRGVATLWLEGPGCAFSQGENTAT